MKDCNILALKRDNDCRDLVSAGKLFHKFTDEGIKEFAKISVRPAFISLSSAFRYG